MLWLKALETQGKWTLGISVKYHFFFLHNVSVLYLKYFDDKLSFRS